MKRRQVLAGAAALGLARPAIGGTTKTLIHVPQANLTSLDPVWTTAMVTRNCGGMIFETLFGRDEKLTPKLQMLSGYLVEDGGLRVTMTLRDGLMFHDGTPVLSRDCIASVQRWMRRDPIGATILSRLDALEAKDDKTFVWRLKKPMTWLPAALSKTQPTPAIMPERLALTDPFKQIPEAIGSGPFRFVAGEYVSGHSAVFEKFDRYSPRNEPASFCAGGYNVLVDRVEWRIMPDPSTAANALMNGEVDWLDSPLPDLLGMLRKKSGVVVQPIDIYGTLGGLRPNHLHGATANQGVRQAIMAAMNQEDIMTAVMGDDQSLWRAPVGFFMPGSPSENDGGMEWPRKHRSTAEIKEMLKKAGYAGEKVVFMHATDQVYYHAMNAVIAASLREVGINLDEQMMDWGTVVERRTSKEPIEKGGWSLFAAGLPVPEYQDPVFASIMRCSGDKAWFGWPSDDQLEHLRDQWLDSSDPAEKKKLDFAIQARAFEVVPFVPLGQYLPPAAWRSNVSGLLKGALPVFWNVTKG